MKKENGKQINKKDSMLDISYHILKNHSNPMSIHQLIEQVLKIKKIEPKQKEKKFLQLYLDIVSSGIFVFHGGSRWSIKDNNLYLWDQEYFLTEEEKIIKKENINIPILDLQDYDLEFEKEEKNFNEEMEIENLDNKEIESNPEDNLINLENDNISESLNDLNEDVANLTNNDE